MINSLYLLLRLLLLLFLPTAPLTTPCVFGIFADWRQFALEIDACTTDVTSLGWGGVGVLTFML